MATAQPAGTKSNQIDVLAAVLGRLAVGVVLCDKRGSLVFFNSEAERILGIGLTDARQKEWAATYGCYLSDATTPMPPEDLPLARALRGEHKPSELVFIRNRRQTAGVWIDVTAYPLLDRAGSISGAVAMFSDVTEPQRLRLHTVRSPGAEGGRPGELSDRFARMRDCYELMCKAVEQTADGIVITDTDGVIEYVNPAFEETTGYSAPELLGRTPRILKSGRHDEAFYRNLWGKLLAGEPFCGVIVNRKKSGELYWAEQTISPIRDNSGAVVRFVSVLKDVTESREQQRQEFYMQLAREVQQRYYRIEVAVPGLDLAAGAHPAQMTGGDYFDFIPLGDGSLLLAIADISGHGFGSAFVMAETRATLRAHAAGETEIGPLLRALNAALLGSLGGNRFVTMLLARIDPSHRSMKYASAGHETGYVVRRSGELRAALASTAPPLGIFASQDYGACETVALEEGDTILLLTDGITEAVDERDAALGTEAAIDFVRRNPQCSAKELEQGLFQLARSFAGSAPQADDITAVVCRVGPRA